MALWDDTPSDGVFHHYWSTHDEFEYAYGPFDSFEAAKADALSQAVDAVYGPEPGSTVYVVRADKRTTVPPVFDTEALIDAYCETGQFHFDSEQVLDLFMEANEDCWGDHGWDGLTGDSEAAATALISGLCDAAAAWIVSRHPDDVTAEEDLQKLLQDAVRAWEVRHRAQIVTWLFGRMEEPVPVAIPELSPQMLRERTARFMQRQFGISREEALALLQGAAESSPT